MNSQTYKFYFSWILIIFSSILLGVLTTTATLENDGTSATRNPVADFDGDGKSDISVFRPSNGFWYVMKSSGGFSSTRWGLGTDTLTPGDYDGDGKADFAVYRRGLRASVEDTADNTYYILRSSDNTFSGTNLGVNTGFYDTAPVPADYDGDSKTDMAVYSLSDGGGAPGKFIVLQSSTDATVITQWGTNLDRRVPADYDGDGKVDLAVYRDNSIFGTDVGIWFILQSSDGKMRVERFGLPSDKLVPADYDGDGKTDIAVWRPSNGFWYRINSSNNSFYAEQFGLGDDKPVPADYDGDGKTDLAVFRPSTGVWYLNRSTQGFFAQPFGFGDDIPIPNVFVR